MDLARVIQYTDIFPEQKDNLPDVEKLIVGINRAHLCTMTANMFSRLVEQRFFDNDLDSRKEEFDYLRFFLSGQNAEFLQDAVSRYRNYKQNEKLDHKLNVKHVATTNAAVMTFQRQFFALPPTTDALTTQTEIDFFKALLIINQNVYEFDFDEKKHEGEPTDLRLAHLLLANNYANEDVDASDLNDAFRRQLVKGVELFSFLCRDKRMKPIRERFYEHFRIGNWVDYIIPHIMCLHWLKQKSGLLVVEGKHITGRRARRVLKKSSIEYQDIIPYEDNVDYREFRGRPFIHLGKYRYAITDLTFVVEHIYNSVYFELKKYRKDGGFTDDGDFRRYFTTEFSQNFMLNRFVRKGLSGKEIVVLDGKQCDVIVREKKADKVNPPDFYLRYANNCVIFEFKDTFLSAKLKDEKDPEKFFEEIKKKFLVSQDGSLKGVAQLMSNAKAIQEGNFIFDDIERNFIVYPVLVVDNPVYTIRGMHTKLEYLMRDYCNEKGIDGKYVKPLILVDVATLRLYSNLFSNKGFPAVFEEYYNAIKLTPNAGYDEAMNSLMSFSEYMKQKKTSDMGQVFNQLMKQAEPYYKNA